MQAGLSGPGLVVEQIRERRDGRIEGELAFDSVAALCGAALLRRDCRYEASDGGFEFTMGIPARTAERPRTARAEIRIRAEGRITGHNSESPLRRGNVLVWSRPLDRLAAEGLELRVRTGGTSVFATTARTVLTSALIAFGVVGIGLLLLVAEGRRRLARQHGSRPARLGS